METIIVAGNATETGNVYTDPYPALDVFSNISSADSAHSIPMHIPAADIPHGMEATIGETLPYLVIYYFHVSSLL